MKVEHSGFYKTRDKRLAECSFNQQNQSLHGYIEGSSGTYSWSKAGRCSGCNEMCDVVEYLGKERPKERKTVKMAPALYCIRCDSRTFITPELYKSEQEAKNDIGKIFVRWLIDTPMAIEVEVEV
jgi:hypothetical protein